MEDKFALYKKWFWVGIVISIFNVVAGLIYGIALTAEKDHRKEGAIIIVFAIAWFVFTMFVLSPWLLKFGILPNYKLLKVN